jgi:hypothetical protein
MLLQCHSSLPYLARTLTGAVAKLADIHTGKCRGHLAADQ